MTRAILFLRQFGNAIDLLNTARASTVKRDEREQREHGGGRGENDKRGFHFQIPVE